MEIKSSSQPVKTVEIQDVVAPLSAVSHSQSDNDEDDFNDIDEGLCK